jgi:hypothetical protein
MSCSITPGAVRDRTKTATRRHPDTWKDLRRGDRITLIEKGMGLAKGEQHVVLAEVEVLSNEVEPLGFIGPVDLVNEGLPDMTRSEFMRMWADAHGCGTCDDRDLHALLCRRIEWRYLNDPCPECKNQFDGKMPGHKYGSNWDWVPCQTCRGEGFISRLDGEK